MANLLELEDIDVQEHYFEAGWTDGLPVVPPTPDRVMQMLLGGGVQDPDEIVGSVPQRRVDVTAEMAAINAVMAGCRPEYFPIVLGALAAVLDPAFNAHTACTSTGGAALCVVVSGPMAAEVGMNSTHNALGSGNRANATIGRSVRLVANNVLGAKTGKLDGSSVGHPGKYSFCFAEEPPPGPWDPLGVALGYADEDTTVTVMPTEGPHQVANHLSEDAEGVLRTFATAARNPATFMVGKRGQGIVVLGWEHRQAVIDGGMSRRDVQEFLFRHAGIPAADLEAAGVHVEEATGTEKDMVPRDDGLLSTFASPDHIYVTTAGGAGAGWSAYVPSWAPPVHAQARAVTRRVRLPGEDLPLCGPDGCEVDLGEEGS